MPKDSVASTDRIGVQCLQCHYATMCEAIVLSCPVCSSLELRYFHPEPRSGLVALSGAAPGPDYFPTAA